MTIRYPFLHRARLAIRNNRPLDPITARQMLTALEELANYIERLERIAANEQPDLCELLEETGLVPTEEVRRIRAEQARPRVIEVKGTLRGPAPSVGTGEGEA